MEVYVCEGAYSRPAFLADLTLPFGRKEVYMCFGKEKGTRMISQFGVGFKFIRNHLY